MVQDRPGQHLSRISTLWTLVHKAHGGSPSSINEARSRLIERYSGAIHRYLLGALRDADAADELFQDLCVRLLRGDFRNADRERGRFRDFIKTAVFHMVIDYQKRRQKLNRPAGSGLPEPAVDPASASDSEKEFLLSWKDELMERTWLALAEDEKRTGQLYYTVLRFRFEQPLLSSEQMAKEIGTLMGKAYSIDAIRQVLHRARTKFADLLLEEVIHSLASPTDAQIEAELIELGLLTYCQSALARRAKKKPHP